MRVRPPLRASVTRHDEKEQKLKEFVGRYLVAPTDGRVITNSVLMLVARSIDSPVVKALLALGPDISGAGLSIRLILAQLENDQLPDSWERDLGGLACDVRWARRPR